LSQAIIILVLSGVISVIIGMIAGIPLSSIILKRREQVSLGKDWTFPESESQDISTDQFDKLLEKYGVPKIKNDKQDSEETLERTLERENDESVTIVEQADPMVIDQLLAELEKNHALSAEPRPDKPELFQTDIWDANSNVPNILTASLKWELTQAYVDMSLANNVIWFLKEFDVASPLLSERYKELCDRISTSLGKVIPILKTGKKIEI